jgi:phthalate 4,5-dioxygenase
MVDREAQKTESYTGIASIHGQDQAVTESMGPITDHDFENLGPSDIMIARTRRRLLRAARAFAKDGKSPPGVDDPGIYTQVRSGDFVTDSKIAWHDTHEMQMRAAARPLQQAAE